MRQDSPALHLLDRVHCLSSVLNDHKQSFYCYTKHRFVAYTFIWQLHKMGTALHIFVIWYENWIMFYIAFYYLRALLYPTIKCLALKIIFNSVDWLFSDFWLIKWNQLTRRVISTEQAAKRLLAQCIIQREKYCCFPTIFYNVTLIVISFIAWPFPFLLHSHNPAAYLQCKHFSSYYQDYSTCTTSRPFSSAFIHQHFWLIFLAT